MIWPTDVTIDDSDRVVQLWVPAGRGIMNHDACRGSTCSHIGNGVNLSDKYEAYSISFARATLCMTSYV